MSFTHFDENGASRMVDVSEKQITKRTAVAVSTIQMKQETLVAISDMKIKKGDVLEVARLAAIMGVKQTSSLIPLCHPLSISAVAVDFTIDTEKSSITSEVTVTVSSQTGVEMEALTGASISALTIYDMCKAIDKDMVIHDIKLMKKSGGRSGEYIRNG